MSAEYRKALRRVRALAELQGHAGIAQPAGTWRTRRIYGEGRKGPRGRTELQRRRATPQGEAA
jgi:hypothetical protein